MASAEVFHTNGVGKLSRDRIRQMSHTSEMEIRTLDSNRCGRILELPT